MGAAPFTFQVGLVRSPALAVALSRADALVCAILCGAVHTICWAIAVICFIVSLVYRLIRGLIWLLNGGIMICIYTGGVVWVIIKWAGTRFVRIVILLLR